MKKSSTGTETGWWKRLWAFLLPRSLWTRRFAVAWAGCFFSIIAFDLLWCYATNFRPMGFLSTYVFPAVLSLVLAIPSVTCRRWWPQLIVILLFDALLESNLMYCRTYLEAIPPSSYMLAGNVAQFGNSIFSSIRWIDCLIFVPGILAVVLMGKRKVKKEAAQPYLYTLGASLLVCILISFCHGGMGKHITELKNECYKHAFPPVLYTLPCSFVADLTETVSKVSDSDIAFANAFVEQRMKQAREQEQPLAPASPTRKNLVFIIVESLESWPIGQSIEGQAITPNLNRMLSDSTTWYARNVLSQAGKGRSIDGQLIMTTGLMPTNNYVFSMRYTDSTYPSLAKEMKHALGATSYLLAGDRPNSWNQGVIASSFGIEQGIYREHWDCSESFGKPVHPTDKSLMSQIEAKMRTGEIWPEGETALVEIKTFTMHFPFVIPVEKRTIKLNKTYPAKLAEYIQATNYTDGALGQIVSYLKQRSDWPETMVVIIGDHEGLASQRQEIRMDLPEMAQLVDEGMYVPMIVLNSPRGGRLDREIGQVDVYSTTLDLMGIKPVWPGLGYSAFSPLSGSNDAATQPEQQRAGNAIIAADLLKGKLKY